MSVSASSNFDCSALAVVFLHVQALLEPNAVTGTVLTSDLLEMNILVIQ